MVLYNVYEDHVRGQRRDVINTYMCARHIKSRFGSRPQMPIDVTRRPSANRCSSRTSLMIPDQVSDIALGRHDPNKRRNFFTRSVYFLDACIYLYVRF